MCKLSSFSVPSTPFRCQTDLVVVVVVVVVVDPSGWVSLSLVVPLLPLTSIHIPRDLAVILISVPVVVGAVVVAIVVVVVDVDRLHSFPLWNCRHIYA